MSFFSRKKKHSKASVDTRQPRFPAKSQSQSQSLQEGQQSQPVGRSGPWSTHAPPSEKSLWSFGNSPWPFPRHSYALSTSTTAAEELFLFGGFVQGSPSNDLYVISAKDFSTTLLQTSGDIPSPRHGHRAVLTSTILLIWGGITNFGGKNPQDECSDDYLYLLNLVSHEWTRIMVDGPGPGGRRNHTLTLIGSKLFVFGGRTGSRKLNDIWALDLNSLKSNPFWESYEPALGNEKPPPRASHVTVTIGDCIIIFGGGNSPRFFNDTWSFNTLTREWTELRCTGSIPPPRGGHAAVLIDDIMYVYGGLAVDTSFGDLTALNLSTQRWIAFQNVGPSPRERYGHAMVRDGTRVFVLGGAFLSGAQSDEAKLIYVLDTNLLVYPELDCDIVKHSEKTTQPAQDLSTSHLTQGQQDQPSSSSSEAHAAHDASPFQKAAAEDIGRGASPPVTHEQNPSLNGLPRPEEDDNLVAPDGKEITRLEEGRLIEFERQLSETLDAKTERDRHIGQLTDELARAVEKNKRAGQELRDLQTRLDRALEQAKTNAAEEKKRAGQELRDLQTKLDRALEQAKTNAAEEKKRAGQELLELQARLGESLMSRDRALEEVRANAEGKKRVGLELLDLQARLDESIVTRDRALEEAKANAEEKKRAGQELLELQAKLDESIMSRDRTLEQAKANAAEEKKRARLELRELQAKIELSHDYALKEVRTELEAGKSESAALRMRLADTENSSSKSKAKANNYSTPTATGLVNTNTEQDRIMHKLMERMRVMEAEVSSFRSNDKSEKSFETMECRNEDD